MSASERLLSWILAGFILLALAWAYVNVDDSVREARNDKQEALQQELNSMDESRYDLEQELGVNERLSANALDEAANDVKLAKGDRDTARERYRTELDAGTSSPKLKRAYLNKERQVLIAKSRLIGMQRDRADADAQLENFDADQAERKPVVERRLESIRRTDSQIIFFLRALLAFGILALSLALMRRVAERSPRSLPLAQAAVGASGLLALSMIIDYSEVSFDFESVGPLGLSLLGIILTIGGFVALQRYLKNRRPAKRLRANECANCGYPAGQANFCEGCGNQLLTSCQSCSASRRLGTAHCRACGAA